MPEFAPGEAATSTLSRPLVQSNDAPRTPTESSEVLLRRGPRGVIGLWRQTIREARAATTDTATADTATTDTATTDTGAGGLRVRVGALGPLPSPVFVLGCPRSGTTYLGSLLAELDDASYFFEPALFKYHVRRMYGGELTARTSTWLYRVGLRSLLLAAPGSGRRIIEKNPNHVFAAERLAAAFPHARFVVLTRDGRDVAVSLSEKPWHRADSVGSGKREPGGYLYGPYPHFYIEAERRAEFERTTDLHRCIWIWRRHQEEIERLRSGCGPEQQLHVRYEDLVQEPTTTVDRILGFLDVDPDHREAVHYKSRAGHTGSVGRWRHRLDDHDRHIIEAEAGPLLASLGYGKC